MCSPGQPAPPALLPHSCRAARHATRASRARAYPVSRTRSEYALRWCAGSFGQAHILNTNKRSTNKRSKHCNASPRGWPGALGMPAFRADTPSAVAPCGWLGGGRSPAVGPAPMQRMCASPGWRLQFAAQPPAARRACFGRATPLTDDALRARVPLSPLCPASVVGLAWPTPNDRLTQVS